MEITMKSIKAAILYVALPLVIAAGTVHAQGIGRAGMYEMPPEFGMSMDNLTPQQRTQVIEIKQKMMAMAAEHHDTMQQMDMKYGHEMMAMQNQLLEIYKGH
jgi:hypothetical protein